MGRLLLTLIAASCALGAFAAPLTQSELTILRERDPRYAMPTPSEFAQLLAAKIGGEGNIDGIREIVRLRDATLLHRAAASYSAGPSRQIPEALEALIVEHYGDPQVQPALLGFLARELDKFERYPKYRSRRLFELLHADVRKGSFSHSIRIVATDLPGIEPELAALLPSLPSETANELVMLLGVRRHAPSVPSLVALQARVPFDKDQNSLLQHINWALLQIGTQESVQAVLERMKLLGSLTDQRAGYEVGAIVSAIAQRPAGSPPDFAALRAALPAELVGGSWDTLVKLFLERGEPADWQAVREKLGRAKAIAPDRREALEKRLDAALADPARFRSARVRDEREKDLEKDEARFRQEKAAGASLRERDPARFAVEWRALIERREAAARELGDVPRSVGAKQDVLREYARLAEFLRFTLRKPDEAIAAYAGVARMQAPGVFDLAALGLADLYRFDKRDPKAAVAHYRRILSGLTGEAAQRSGSERLAAQALRWIEREIRYLETGERFSGSVTREDLGVLQVLLLMSALRSDGASGPVDKLPPSQLNLATAFLTNRQMSAAEVGRLARHDPAGYLTAVMAAAATYRESAGARGPLVADARFSTPEKTWALFLASAKKGDAGAMASCFTQDMRGKLQDLFARMSAKELGEMAASFVGFALQAESGGQREATIVRQVGERRMAGFVGFVNQGGEWKIDSM